MRSAPSIAAPLQKIFDAISELSDAFPNRQFTIDGRLVGDIGEVVCGLAYELTLDDVSLPEYDATTANGRRVQIKATFKDSLTFKTIPDLYLGIKLFPDGSFEEVYNGPGRLIYDKYSHRVGIGSKLLSFPINALRVLSEEVADCNRVPLRNMEHE